LPFSGEITGHEIESVNFNPCDWKISMDIANTSSRKGQAALAGITREAIKAENHWYD